MLCLVFQHRFHTFLIVKEVQVQDNICVLVHATRNSCMVTIFSFFLYVIMKATSRLLVLDLCILCTYVCENFNK